MALRWLLVLLLAQALVRALYFALRWSGIRRPFGHGPWPQVATVAGATVLGALGGLGQWPGLATMLGVALAAVALVICAFDLKYLLIPTELTASLAALGLGHNLLVGTPTPLDMALGAGLTIGIFGLVHLLYPRLRGVEGMGLGDVKLGGAIGVAVGVWAVGPIIATASLATLVLGLVLKLRPGSGGRLAAGRIPFAPGLLAATLVQIGAP